MDMFKKRSLLLLIAMVAWFGLLLQFWLSMSTVLSNGQSVMDGLIRYFGFFTILTNMLVALATTTLALSPSSTLGHFISRPSVLGGIVIAILFVSIVYHILLRHLWSPQGLRYLGDVMLHYIVSAGLILYWLLYPPLRRMSIWYPLAWCVYPVIYLIYAFIRGELIGQYPYPFINVIEIGYTRAAVNSGSTGTGVVSFHNFSNYSQYFSD